MEYVVRAKRPEESLWKVLYTDCDLGTTRNVSSLSFETEAVAKAYGKEHYSYESTGRFSYEGAMLENGKKLDTNGRKVFEDANHPGDIYLVPDEIANLFLDYMRNEGAAIYERKTAWVDKTCDIGTVSLDTKANENTYCPFKIDWKDV